MLSVLRNPNSLPNYKFLDWSKLKELADNKINVAEKWIFVLGRVENIVGKGENAGYDLSPGITFKWRELSIFL